MWQKDKWDDVQKTKHTSLAEVIMFSIMTDAAKKQNTLLMCEVLTCSVTLVQVQRRFWGKQDFNIDGYLWVDEKPYANVYNRTIRQVVFVNSSYHKLADSQSVCFKSYTLHTSYIQESCFFEKHCGKKSSNWRTITDTQETLSAMTNTSLSHSYDSCLYMQMTCV